MGGGSGMTIINTSPDRTIQLGYEGEDRVTVLRFRYGADWLENGEGIFNIRVRRHGEHTAYNAQLVADDAENNCLLMTVTNTELSVKGSGEMQVVYSGENFVKKSPIYSYNVSRAVDEVTDPPAQDVYTQIIESLSDLQTDIRQIDGDVADLSELTTAKIGDLTELTTTAKTDLVSAINEVNEHGGGSVTVDSELSTTSRNPVQNKVITARINSLDSDVGTLRTSVQGKADTQTVSALADAVNGLDSDVQGLQTTKADKSYVDTQLATKASTATATASSDGLMSSADKSKLDAVGSIVTVSGTTPTITAESGVRYVCGEVATLDFTPCTTGICDVVFTSGSTPTVVTLPNTVKFPDGAFTAEESKTYEINIMDGVYGVVMSWT